MWSEGGFLRRYKKKTVKNSSEIFFKRRFVETTASPCTTSDVGFTKFTDKSFFKQTKTKKHYFFNKDTMTVF